MKCRGCGATGYEFKFGLCMACRLTPRHKRPLNTHAKPKEVRPLAHSPNIDPAYVDGWNDAVKEMKKK